MKNISKISLLIILATTVSFSSAYALIITAQEGNPTGNTYGTIVYDFESSQTTPSNITGNYIITNTSKENFYAQPLQDGNYFMSAPYHDYDSWNDPTKDYSGSATIYFDEYKDYIGLYWGSLDEFDTLTLLDNDIEVLTINGNYDWSPNWYLIGSAYVNISDIPKFNAVKFSRYHHAFEFDNIALRSYEDNNSAPVPEPSTIILFGTGILGFAAVGRKRKE